MKNKNKWINLFIFMYLFLHWTDGFLKKVESSNWGDVEEIHLIKSLMFSYLWGNNEKNY